LGFWLSFTISNAYVSFTFWEYLQYNISISASVALVIGSFGLALRVFASILAFITVIYCLKNHRSRTLSFVSLILVFEAIYVISYGFNGFDGLEIGDLVLIVQSSINCIIGAIIVPIPLLVLSRKIKTENTDAIIKWGFISGFAYIFMLWFRFVSNWIAVLIQTEAYHNFLPGYGLEYIFNYPINLISFLTTLFGLPLLAFYFIKTDKKDLSKILSKIGWILTLLGFYFYFLFMLYNYGSSVLISEASIWSWFFTGHNYDLWMISLPVLGIPLTFFIIQSKFQELSNLQNLEKGV
jgi:hypothetical protein